MTPDSVLIAVPWGVAADPMTGRIYVADRSAERVVVFDRSGAYQGTYGRSGEGPGEFESPSALSVGPYGALTVWDTGRGVLSRWSSEGDLLNERRAPLVYWGPGVYERPGRLVTVTSQTSASEMRQSLIELTASDTVVLHTVPRDMVMMELPCIRQPASRLFAPSVVWAPAGDTVYVLNGPEYRIDTYADGALDSSIRRPVEPVRVTVSMAVDQVRVEYAGFMRTCGVTAEQIVDALGHEELVPTVQWITVDPGGRLWVSRSSNGLVAEHIDILDADGRYEGTMDAAVLPVVFVSRSRFVGLTLREETGETVLSLYDLQASESSGGAAAESGQQTWAPELHLDVREFRDCPECPIMVELPPGRFSDGGPGRRGAGSPDLDPPRVDGNGREAAGGSGHRVPVRHR
jgi:DNA-binding beta-propeller fold protein YncE